MSQKGTITTVQTVLFDLDGTLADTAPDLALALNTVLDENGGKPLSYDVIRPVVSHGASALIYLGFELDPEDQGYDEIRDRLLSLYSENVAANTQLFPGMNEVLDELERRGLNWGIVTNKPSWLTEPLVHALALDQRASCVVSGDTTPNSKPHPEPMLYACKAIGTRSSECLYVGDARRDIEAGRNAGMTTLAALFGYIGDHESPADWGADGMIETPYGIIDWLDQVQAKAV